MKPEPDVEEIQKAMQEAMTPVILEYLRMERRAMEHAQSISGDEERPEPAGGRTIFQLKETHRG